MELRYPVLLCLAGDLSVCDAATLAIHDLRFEPPDTMTCKESYVSSARMQWLIQCDGTLLAFTYLGAEREWARALKMIGRFVRSRYRHTAPRQPKVNEVAALVAGLKDKFEEAPVAADLRRFLAALDPQAPLDEPTMQRWLRGEGNA